MPSWLSQLAHYIEQQSEFTGRAVSWLTLLMILLTFAIALLRYGFDFGLIALQDVVGYLHILVFMFGMAYTLNNDGHVRVDIIYNRLSGKGRAWVDLLGTLLLLLPVSIYIFVSSWNFVADSWRVMEGSREAGGLGGVYLIKTVILLMAVQLSLQGLARLIRCVATIRGQVVAAKHG